MKCILFDLDGTLADTEVLKAKALSQTIQSFGGQATPEFYKKVMGRSWEVVTSAYLQSASLQIPLSQLNPIFRENYSHLIRCELRDLRGARKLVSLLRQSGYRLAVVTSAASWMMEMVLKQLDLQNAFDVLISGNDTKNHKPDPECYLLALFQLGTKASDALVFEDSESGFQAASAAGLKVIGIKHKFNEAHDFSSCEQVIESFDEWKIPDGDA